MDQNRKILLILIIGLAFVLVVCIKLFYQNEQITIAKGLSENPENPKIAMEINENGDVFIYIDSVSKRKTSYFKGSISKEDWQNSKSIFENRMEIFKTKPNPFTTDATKYELDVNINGLNKNIIMEQDKLSEDIINMIDYYKTIKLSTISNHSFKTKIQLEQLPIPPTIP